MNEETTLAALRLNDGLGLRHWKDVDCPTCYSKKGQSCGKTKIGAFHWIRTAPHIARKRLANTPTLEEMREILSA